MRLTCFGELMLRLTPAVKGQKIVSSHNFSVDYAGAESNVASALAHLGNSVNFVSKLPNNSLGNAAMASLNRYGIDTSNLLRGGERIGTYFIELGASIRPSSVIYDRANSALAAIQENEFDWPQVLKGSQWLHVSGITPAISNQCANETVKAVKAAHAMGIKVSFDLNFRRTLWANVEDARQIFLQIMEYTDLLHGNCGVLKDVFDLDYSGQSSIENTVAAASDVQQKFAIDGVALTSREHHSASVNGLSGVYLQGAKCVTSSSYQVDILDRFGTGDAFAAGILHGIMHDFSPQESVDFATAAFALKHTILGDQLTATKEDIHSISGGNISGHVIR
ncbi:MAG: sugar kinase [Paraglaciecola sp.]|uniref:sugar kinase n=1 Tax=Paraglaciecola sp. TaxID=1920173 RepID=UPI0032969C78